MTNRSTEAERSAYDELCAWTLTRHDAAFSHQHVVDAFAAQHATAEGKPIGIAFALVGLYLHLERQFTGKAVQRAHMVLAQRKVGWPEFLLPEERGSITAIDVLAAAPGDARDRAIDDWCRSVWAAYDVSRPAVLALLRERGIL